MLSFACIFLSFRELYYGITHNLHKVVCSQWHIFYAHYNS